MTSERQRRANQGNARRSTGPRTAAGKAKAAQNSFRYGLAIDIRSDSALCDEIEELAQQYCEAAFKPARLMQARTAAEAQFDINRVRKVRTACIEQAAISGPGADSCSPTAGMDDGNQLPPASRVTKMLLQLERYERRALSRRKKALRALLSN